MIFSPIYRFLFSATVLLSFSLHAQAQTDCGNEGRPDSLTTAGTQFLVVFEQNEQDGQIFDEVYQEIYVATGGQPAFVEITTRSALSYREAFTLDKHSSKIVRIPNNVDGVVNTSEFVDDRVFRVNATAPIVCFGLNHKQYTADAFVALPKNTAGLEFRVMSYYSSVTDQYRRPPQFAVAAFEDNTEVTIIPSAETAGGRPARTPFVMQLNAGQCVQVQGKPMEPDLDLTGSIVRSNKPVAVYGSHVRTEIPEASTIAYSRDHLAESIPPVSTWGRRFVVADYPFPGTSRPDLVRVLALYANTQVSINGSPWRTLGADQFADTLYNGFLTIEATGPVLVGTYAHSTGTSSVNELGDPFFVIVPPVEQTFRDFTFFSSEDPVYQQHFVVIITERSGKDRILLDSVLQPSILFRDVPDFSNGRKYSIARIGIDPGKHRLQSQNNYQDGIIALAYGFGLVDSYGNLAGAVFAPKNGLVPVKDVTSGPIGKRINKITMRNATSETIFFDTVKLVIDGGNEYGIRLKQDLVSGIRQLRAANELTVSIEADREIDRVMNGMLYIHTHTPKWDNMEVSAIDFTLVPEALADVTLQRDVERTLEIVPHPVHNSSTLAFELAEGGQGKIRLFDEIGREVATLAEGWFSPGANRVSLDRTGLAPGVYVYELAVPSQDLLIRCRILVQ